MKQIYVFYINNKNFTKKIIKQKLNNLITISKEYDDYYSCTFFSYYKDAEDIEIRLINLFDLCFNKENNFLNSFINYIVEDTKTQVKNCLFWR